MTFTARFASRCGICDEQIREGDPAPWVDDEVVHATCPTPVALAEPCPKCWMLLAVNGTCDCEGD